MTSTVTYPCKSCGHDYDAHSHLTPGAACRACARIEHGLPCYSFKGRRPPACFGDGTVCPWWCSDHQDPGRVDPEAHRGQIQVSLDGPMPVLEGATMLSIGMHHDANGRRSLDVCAVDPWGDVLGGLSPRAARRLAATLVAAADFIEGVDR